MPLSRTSRCSRSVRWRSRKIVVWLDTVIGAGKPGASKVTVRTPSEMMVRSAAAWRAAAAWCRATISSTVSGLAAATLTSAAKRSAGRSAIRTIDSPEDSWTRSSGDAG